MTGAMNMSTLKGKILMAAALLVCFVALSAAAKPAEAATTCDSSAVVPYRIWINNTPYVQFPLAIKCTGLIYNAHMTANAGVWSASEGRWLLAKQPGTNEFVTRSGWFNRQDDAYSVHLRLKCTEPYTTQRFRSAMVEAKTVALTGYQATLPNRVSGITEIKC